MELLNTINSSPSQNKNKSCMAPGQLLVPTKNQLNDNSMSSVMPQPSEK